MVNEVFGDQKLCQGCKHYRSCECEENMICEMSGCISFDTMKLDDDDDNLIECGKYVEAG